MSAHLHPLSSTDGDCSSEAEPWVETISPELVLVDPELAERGRALLPWPEPWRTQPALPLQGTQSVVPLRESLATTEVARPVETGVAAVAAEAEALPPAGRESPFGFGRRLAAVALLLPAAIGLALLGEFVAGSGDPLGAAVPRKDAPSPRGFRAVPNQRTRQQSSSGHDSAPAATTSSSNLARHRSRPESLVGEIGRRPAAVTETFGAPASWKRNGEYCRATWTAQGLTLIFVARRPRAPCRRGRAVGGFTTSRKWQTGQGLSVGSSLAQLRRRYPHAEAVGSGWWMLATILRSGSWSGIPLHAHVTAGRVDKILVN